MSKSLNAMLSAMLLFSVVAPTASAETTDPSTQQKVEETTTPVDTSETSADSTKAPASETIVTPTDDSAKKEDVKTEETSKDKPTGETPSKEATNEEATKEESTDGEAPVELPTSEDIQVDLTSKPYKDGIHLEIRYMNSDERTATPHIPTFKVAIADAKGNVQGWVEASKSNYSKADGSYNLVIPYEKGLTVGQEFIVYFYDADETIKHFTVKESYTENGKIVTNEYIAKNKEHHKLAMTVVTYEDENGKMTLDYAYSKMAPLEAYIETNENLLLFSMVDTSGNPIKNTQFTIEYNDGKTLKAKTDNQGYMYVDSKKLTSRYAKIYSDNYHLANSDQVYINKSSSQSGRIAMTRVEMTTKRVIAPNEVNDPKQDSLYGMVNVNAKSNGDGTLSSNWKDADLTFKNTKNGDTFTMNIGTASPKGTARLQNGTYEVTANSKYAKVSLSSKTVTVKNNTVNLDVTLEPIYTLEISKDGKEFSYVFMNVGSLTDKEFKGTSSHVYGVVPGEAYIVRDKSDNKEYTAVIKQDATQTKLVLGVGVVWGGEVSTPHTGDNIIFLVSLFLTCLILAGVGFYFHKSGKRVRNTAVTSVIILALLGSLLPMNIAKASDGVYIHFGEGSTSSNGSSAGGSYTQTPRGAIQVHANYSLMAVTLIAETSQFLNDDTTQDAIRYSANDIFGTHRLAYTFFVAANQNSYNKAKAGNTSFMMYDPTRKALAPIWGTSNTVVDVSTTMLSKNQAAFGVKNNAFSTRVLPFIYSDYKINGEVNDFAYMMGMLVNELGTGNNGTRQLWKGKDILGNNSGSTKNIGDAISLNLADKYMEIKKVKYPESKDPKKPLPLDTIVQPFKTLVNATSSAEKSKWFNETLGFTDSWGWDCKDEGDLRTCNYATENESHNLTLVFQMVNAVYESGSASGPMTFIPINDLAAWYHDSMNRYNAAYKNKNFHRLDVAKMVYYGQKNFNLSGSNNSASYMTAPTKTFVGNVAGTTAKAITPKNNFIKQRTSDTDASVQNNPFSGWGYLYFSTDAFTPYYLGEPNGSITPALQAFIEYKAVDKDGNSVKSGRVPWNYAPNGKNVEFLSKLKSDTHYFKYGSTIVDGKFQYKIKEGSMGKLTLKDITDKESLLKMVGDIDALNANKDKYTNVFDGDLFFLDPEYKDGVESFDIPQKAGGGFELMSTIDIPPYEGLNKYLKVDEATMETYNNLAEKDPTAMLKRLEKGHPSGKVSTSKYPMKGVSHDFKAKGEIKGVTFSDAELVLAVEAVLEGCTNGGLIENNCELPKPGEANSELIVPQWRLSEYFEDATNGVRSDAFATIRPPGRTWDSPTLTNSGINKFILVSPNLSEVPWAESVAKLFNGDTPERDISPFGGSYRFQLGGDLLAIKENSTVTNTKLAAWKNTVTAVSPKVGNTFKGEPEPNGKSSITKKHTFTYKVKFPYSDYLYTELIVVCGPKSCWKERTKPAPSALSTVDSINNVTVTFKRHNPEKDKTLKTFEKKTDSVNGYYWESYQDTQVIKVNPEVSMVVDDRNGNSTPTISAGDYLRDIKPVHYNSVNFENVEITPKVDGMSTATDTSAKALASKLGVPNNDVIYKGASTSVNFEAKKPQSEIVLRTFALDIGSTALKTQWGNGTYSTDAIRDEFLGRYATKESDGTWSIKVNSKGNYVINSKDEGGVNENKTIKQKKYEVKEHTLVVRGGTLISVDGQKDFSKLDGELVKALNRMEISTKRGENVFTAFEYNKGEVIKEQKAIDIINKARDIKDLSSGKPWYYEDTTQLVVREYITTYDVPSYMYVDKIPQEIKGIATPMDKSKYFKDSPAGKGGFTGYAKYRITLKDAWMEYNSSEASPFGGKHAKLYSVPNVSVVDTMQMQ